MACKYCTEEAILYGPCESAMLLKDNGVCFEMWVNYEDRLACNKGWKFCFNVNCCPMCGERYPVSANEPETEG